MLFAIKPYLSNPIFLHLPFQMQEWAEPLKKRHKYHDEHWPELQPKIGKQTSSKNLYTRL